MDPGHLLLSGTETTQMDFGLRNFCSAQSVVMSAEMRGFQSISQTSVKSVALKWMGVLAVSENYRFPCGVVDQEGDEAWQCEISCILVGCKNCKHFDGTEYYERNVSKGIGMWARKQRGVEDDK